MLRRVVCDGVKPRVSNGVFFSRWRQPEGKTIYSLSFRHRPRTSQRSVAAALSAICAVHPHLDQYRPTRPHLNDTVRNVAVCRRFLHGRKRRGLGKNNSDNLHWGRSAEGACNLRRPAQRPGEGFGTQLLPQWSGSCRTPALKHALHLPWVLCVMLFL